MWFLSGSAQRPPQGQDPQQVCPPGLLTQEERGHSHQFSRNKAEPMGGKQPPPNLTEFGQPQAGGNNQGWGDGGDSLEAA